MSTLKEKQEFIAGYGFRPMSDNENETLYTDGKYVFPLGSFESVERVKNELERLGLKKPTEYPQEEQNEAGDETAGGNAGAEAASEAGTGGTESDTTQAPSGYSDGDIIGFTEPVDPFYIADIVRAVPTPVFRRFQQGDNRYYYRTLDDGSVKMYASATTLIKDGYADNKDGLNEWKMQMKFLGQNPEDVARYEADKGTIMHYLFDLFLTGRDIYLSRQFIRDKVKEGYLSISEKNLNRFMESDSDLDDMKVRLFKFAKFCSDYKVVPVMIEKILSYEEYNVASPIDLVCQMTVEEKVEGYFGAVYQRSGNGYKKGDPKKETKIVERSFYAIVDFKSGGIYSSHSLQLELYRRMVTQWYGDLIPVEKIYNFSPKSESSKGYTLRDQTECSELKKADAVYAQGMIAHENKNKMFKSYGGVLNIKKDFSESDYMKEYVIKEELEKLSK